MLPSKRTFAPRACLPRACLPKPDSSIYPAILRGIETGPAAALPPLDTTPSRATTAIPGSQAETRILHRSWRRTRLTGSQWNRHSSPAPGFEGSGWAPSPASVVIRTRSRAWCPAPSPQWGLLLELLSSFKRKTPIICLRPRNRVSPSQELPRCTNVHQEGSRAAQSWVPRTYEGCAILYPTLLPGMKS